MAAEAWVHVGSFDKTDPGTYTTYKGALNAVEVHPDIAALGLKTATDVHKHADKLEQIVGSSPTACFFVKRKNVVYCDQQGCVVWTFEPEKGVVTTHGVKVAETLPEFFSRMRLDNALWYAMFVPWRKGSMTEELKRHMAEAPYVTATV